MEPGDWKYAVVIAVMVGSLALVAVSVPRMDEAERRFVAETRAGLVAEAAGNLPLAQAHYISADQAGRDRLTWGSLGTLGALGALVSLLSIFFIGVRGPMGRGGMSRQSAKEDEGEGKAGEVSGGPGRAKSGQKVSRKGGAKVG